MNKSQLINAVAEQTSLSKNDVKKAIDAFFAIAEEKLQQTALGYQRRRKDGTLGAVEVCLMKKGWQEELYRNRLKPRVSISQIKLPVIINEEPKADWKEKR